MTTNTTDRPERLRILHLTDSHLLPEPGRTFLGIDTELSLRSVIRLANTSERSFDLALFTGDLAQEASERSYERVVAACAELALPCYCLPGNHDDANLMRKLLPRQSLRWEPYLRAGAWLIVCLDSTVSGSPAGTLAPSELLFLERVLRDHSDCPTLVALHHHPIPCGSQWMDSMMLTNAADFFQVLQRHPQVCLVLHGHAHQVIDVQRNRIRVLGSPSTCFQFTPRSWIFSIDPSPPGYRWIEVDSTGSIATGICRLPQPCAGLDLSSTGY
jgi:Icc protein